MVTAVGSAACESSWLVRLQSSRESAALRLFSVNCFSSAADLDPSDESEDGHDDRRRDKANVSATQNPFTVKRLLISAPFSDSEQQTGNQLWIGHMANNQYGPIMLPDHVPLQQQDCLCSSSGLLPDMKD
ncbi:hypothetical protein ABVT39_026130 [Epinephelus coioides]